MDQDRPKGKYMVTIQSTPGLMPRHHQGVFVEATTVEEAKRLALDKAPKTGKFKNRTRSMWRIPPEGVMLLGGAKNGPGEKPNG